MKLNAKNPFTDNPNRGKCLRKFFRFLTKQGVKRNLAISHELIRSFIEKRINKWDRLNKLKPYMMENFKVDIMHILEYWNIRMTMNLKAKQNLA